VFGALALGFLFSSWSMSASPHGPVLQQPRTVEKWHVVTKTVPVRPDPAQAAKLAALQETINADNAMIASQKAEIDRLKLLLGKQMVPARSARSVRRTAAGMPTAAAPTAAPPTTASSKKHDPSSFAHVTRSIQRWNIPPLIRLPVSGVTISLWVILLVAFVGGLFSGFLGGGAGYIRMPSMVYVLGIPTHLAVGTDLFEIIISASYGTFSHAIKGNVDILIALVMHTGAAIGAQIGAISTQYFTGPKIRLAFVPLPLIGAAIVIYTLMTGHKL